MSDKSAITFKHLSNQLILCVWIHMLSTFNLHVSRACNISMDIVKNIDISSYLDDWTRCYGVSYSTATTTADLLSCAKGDAYYIFVGAKKNSSSQNIYLGAFAPNSVLTTNTSSNRTAYKPSLLISGYNVYWYNYPYKSFGFAPNSTIYLNAADLVNRYGDQDNRLSWHLDIQQAGCRAGKYVDISTPWRKVIYYKYCPQISPTTTSTTTTSVVTVNAATDSFTLDIGMISLATNETSHIKFFFFTQNRDTRNNFWVRCCRGIDINIMFMDSVSKEKNRGQR